MDEYEPGIYSCCVGRLAGRESLTPTTHSHVSVLTRSDTALMTAAAPGGGSGVWHSRRHDSVVTRNNGRFCSAYATPRKDAGQKIASLPITCPSVEGPSKVEAILWPDAWRKADGVAFAGWDPANAFNHGGLLGNNAEAPPAKA